MLSLYRPGVSKRHFVGLYSALQHGLYSSRWCSKWANVSKQLAFYHISTKMWPLDIFHEFGVAREDIWVETPVWDELASKVSFRTNFPSRTMQSYVKKTTSFYIGGKRERSEYKYVTEFGIDWKFQTCTLRGHSNNTWLY